MTNKKIAVLVILIGIYISYDFNLTHIPQGLERPFFFRVKFYAIKTAGILSKIGHELNLGTHASNIRTILSFYTRLIKTNSIDVNITDTKMNNVNVRIYEKFNSGTEPRSIMIYFHGGGYSFGDLNTYDMFLIEISNKMNMIVVSVDYRLAPEFPFPIPTQDCFDVVKYLLENPDQFRIDLDKLVIAGDSAGGNAVAVTVQRMLKENLKLPKVQVLIYPWLQMLTFQLPSMLAYSHTGLIHATQIDLITYVSWYLGVQKKDYEVEKNLLANNHTLLIGDKQTRKLIESYLNTSQIPEEYRKGREYYKKEKRLFPNYELEDDHLFKRDPQYAKHFRMTIDPRVTPLFADHNDLIGLPKSYFLMIEWDSLKDEGMLYAERLRKAGVDVKIQFYEHGFHGMASLVSESTGYELAKVMLNDLIQYLQYNL